MKFHIALLLMLPLAAFAQTAPNRPTASPNPSANRYATVSGFFKLPQGRAMGSSSAVSGDSKGHVWVVDRCGANDCAGSKLDPVMEFDAGAISCAPGVRANSFFRMASSSTAAIISGSPTTMSPKERARR